MRLTQDCHQLLCAERQTGVKWGLGDESMYLTWPLKAVDPGLSPASVWRATNSGHMGAGWRICALVVTIECGWHRTVARFCMKSDKQWLARWVLGEESAHLTWLLNATNPGLSPASVRRATNRGQMGAGWRICALVVTIEGGWPRTVTRFCMTSDKQWPGGCWMTNFRA